MEIQWIGVAFVVGLIARALRQPPVLGFLAAGFLLEILGLRPDASLEELADIGVSLLLFTIGLKLDVREIAQPHVWALGSIHMAVSTGVAALCLFGLGAAGVGIFEGLAPSALWPIAFGLSFSSTIVAVKLLEDRNDLGAVYGRGALGILVVQDLAAVAFIAATAEEGPSLWALALFLLWPLRPLWHRILDRSGHGELLVLAGLAATLGTASLFKVTGLKADLGALAAGLLLGGHPKTSELAKSLYSFKDVFLVGFFLAIGLTGLPTWETLAAAGGLLLVLPVKTLLFVALGLRFRLRARTSLLLGASLSQLSEFGLIVLAALVARGQLDSSWLVAFAIALSASFIVSVPVNNLSYAAYRRLRTRLLALEHPRRILSEEPVDASEAEVLIFGMGRLGTATYERMVSDSPYRVVAFDVDPEVVKEQAAAGRDVRLGSSSDPDLWERLHLDRSKVRWVILTMVSQQDMLTSIRQLQDEKVHARVAATARHRDHVEQLKTAGAELALHVYEEAGSGFASHILTTDAASANRHDDDGVELR